MGRWEPSLKAQERELGPPVELTGDGVSRSSLYGNPAGHEAAGLVTATAGLLVEKYQATAKPNARRMGFDCEGASGMMVTLTCDGC